MRSLLLELLGPVRALRAAAFPPSCRFAPTCSAFAAEAIRRRGAWTGLLLSAARILRCHPWNPGGYDPVPGA